MAAKKPVPREVPAREEVLRTAITLTCGDRDASYGPPGVNLACASALFSIYQEYREKTGQSTSSAHDAAIFNVLQKIARIATGAEKEDNYVDGAAYMAIAYEVREI
ncbi:MAG TPA: DUF6378 domain-containing protein [Terriglobia bacterium]|nr:DUF6378 domain-containing protein [Terriglobia bacterium]